MIMIDSWGTAIKHTTYAKVVCLKSSIKNKTNDTWIHRYALLISTRGYCLCFTKENDSIVVIRLLTSVLVLLLC